MKITVLALDIPFPPVSGGRVDLWSHLRVLAQAGFELQVWSFSREACSSEQLNAISAAGIARFRVLPVNGYWRDAKTPTARLCTLAKKAIALRPLCCSSTEQSLADLALLVKEISEFGPDLLLSHGIQTAGVLRQVASRLPSVPWIYRSHNRETAYFSALAKAAPWGLSKLSLALEAVRLAKFEPTYLRSAGAVLHISKAERDYFAARGFDAQLWSPPVYHATMEPRSFADVQATWDVGILSSWFASQKIEGLRWFGENVRPRLPETWKIAVAGSSAPPWLSSWCTDHGMMFIGLVENPAEFYARCRSVANPVLRGAGVNMKTVEILTHARAMVSTTAGLAGLPADLVGHVHVADDEAGFANALIGAESNPLPRVSHEILAQFAPERFIETLRSAYDIASGKR